MRKKTFSTVAEIMLIVALSAAAGIAWNRTLLTSAWRGQLTQQAEAAPAAGQQPQQGQDAPMPVALVQVKEMLDAKQAVVIDARNPASFAEGHIAGAVALPLAEAAKNPSTLKGKFPKDSTIIAYCNGFSCHDSMELGKLLLKAGYGSVFVYEGGFPEWQDAGYPVAKGGR